MKNEPTSYSLNFLINPWIILTKKNHISLIIKVLKKKIINHRALGTKTINN
jgi:hypothetical protein